MSLMTSLICFQFRFLFAFSSGFELIVCHYRPDGEKKAYVRLAPDYDALDVANKVN